MVIFALRAKAKDEKIKRSQYYANLHSEKVENREPQNQEITPNVKRDEIPEEENEEFNEKVKSKRPETNHKLEKDKSEIVPLDEDQKEENSLEKPKTQNNNLVNQINSSNNNLNYDMEDEDQDEDENDIVLKLPDGLWKKIVHIFQFPILVILYFVPNYKKSPTVKKLVFCMLLNLGLLAGIIFLLNRWLHVAAVGMLMTNESMGYTFSAIGFTYPFFKYNMKIAANDKDVDFMQSFLQLGIFKLGICVGLSWLFACIITLNSTLNISPVSVAFAITISVYVGLLLLLTLAVVLNRFQLSSKISIFYLALFSIFYAIAIPILEKAQP